MDMSVGDWWPVLWDSGALAMAVLGPARTYVQVNAAFCRLLEADAPAITAWPYERVGHPLDLDAELDAFVRLSEGAATVVYHRRFRTANEGVFNAEVRLCAGPADQVLQVVLPGAAPVTTDGDHCARRLEQIGSALSHDALEPVRLSGVQAGLLAARYAQVLDERGRNTVAAIERAALKAGNLMRGLAGFARLGLPRPAGAPVRLRPLVDAAWGAQPAKPPDAVFTVVMADDLHLPCDPEQITRVLQELLANALRFREPTRALTLQVAIAAAAGRVTISVSDNGRGIAAIDQPRLFRIYAAIGSDAGIGMGLAMVRAVVEGHGGQVVLESGSGQGSRVSFTLPC